MIIVQLNGPEQVIGKCSGKSCVVKQSKTYQIDRR